MVFRKKIWAVDVLNATRVSLLLRPSQMTELRNMFTNFSHSRITYLYCQFTSLDKGENGALSRDYFQLIPELVISPLGGEDQVNFHGFIKTLAQFQPTEYGGKTTSYTLLFWLYDLDKDDRISHNELFQPHHRTIQEANQDGVGAISLAKFVMEKLRRIDINSSLTVS
ncbi:unnamed protein product [Nyctereutes procyonoides]|uniref:(raccoon dog) hypothetical protein n=1 Tax=Nyctereutes procyonoides TaxID=34880 RepID=A0A811YZE5_NYCPR|nr:unnamed protein product [Nyctereutes procyonoides]